VVAISLLQRAVAAEIERDWVRPVRQAVSPRMALPATWAEPRAAVFAS